MSDEEIPVLGCLQVREDTISSIVPGSTQGECAECKHPVWISRSGQAIMAAEPISVRCMECVMTAIKADPDPERTVSAVPGAVDEVRSLVEWLRYGPQ